MYYVLIIKRNGKYKFLNPIKANQDIVFGLASAMLKELGHGKIQIARSRRPDSGFKEWLIVSQDKHTHKPKRNYV